MRPVDGKFIIFCNKSIFTLKPRITFGAGEIWICLPTKFLVGKALQLTKKKKNENNKDVWKKHLEHFPQMASLYSIVKMFNSRWLLFKITPKKPETKPDICH